MSDTKTLAEAAQAVLDRWDSPQWEWRKHGPTADLMHDLRVALDEQAKAQDVTQDGPDYGPAWLGVASARVRAQPGIAAKHLRDYAALLRAQAQAPQIPAGWVPLVIEYEPGYPEDVAFGPQRMMDRLKKWLDRYFAMRTAQAQATDIGCTRSHPHEDMSPECERLTELARQANRAAHAKAQAEPVANKCRVCGGSGKVEQFTSAAAPKTTVTCPFCAGDGKCRTPESCGPHGCHGGFLPVDDAEPSAPQPAQPERKRLTNERVKQPMEENGYDLASPQERSDFISGLRHGEIAHGIGAKG